MIKPRWSSSRQSHGLSVALVTSKYCLLLDIIRLINYPNVRMCQLKTSLYFDMEQAIVELIFIDESKVFGKHVHILWESII